MRAYILGEGRQPVPPGVLGELHVSGAGIARGYLGRPGATDERFLNNPFPEDPNPVLYRTGDLTRYWPNGVIEVLGRLDDDPSVGANGVRLRELNKILAGSPGAAATKRINRLFAELLDRSEVDGQDDFFALSNDTALAERLLADLYTDLGVALTMADLREAPTVDGVAHLVVRAWLGGAPPKIVHDAADRHAPFSLTPPQRQLWRTGDSPPDLYEWHLSCSDAARLPRAWQEVVDRHDALRTVVREDGSQVVVPGDAVTELVDLSGLTAADRRARLTLGRADLRGRTGPAVLRLISLPDGVTAQLAVSPLMADHDSVHRLVLPELSTLVRGESLEPAPDITFRDYARNPLARWSQPDTDPVDLGDRPHGGQAVSIRRDLPATVADRLRARCAAAATTIDNAVVAALHDVLAETDLAWPGGDCLLAQRTTSRVPADPLVDRIVGCFTVWRAVRLTGPTFAERARAVAESPADPAPVRCAVEIAVASRTTPVTTVVSNGPLAEVQVRVVVDDEALRMHWTVPERAGEAEELAGAFAALLARYADDEAAWWEGVDAFNKANGG